MQSHAHGLDRSTRLLLMQGPLAASAAVAVVVSSSGAAWAQNCSSFQNCAQAVASMKDGNTKLDREKDGIPCESLCGSNGENMPKQSFPSNPKGAWCD